MRRTKHDTISTMDQSITILTPSDWTDYELIDSGEGMKLERFDGYIAARPDPRAIWKRRAPVSVWDKAHAHFVRSSNDDGRWDIHTPPPNNWQIRYHDLVFTLKPTSFKHVGVFPEQAVNWQWMRTIINGNPLKVLNLFAYTGGATMAALAAGAQVTHVDSAKSTIEWAKANVAASNLTEKPIRWITDDAYKFAFRETKRKNTYDGIILDPPRFGRGPKGEIWKIENDLPKLLSVCRELLSPNAKFILVNAYTADLSGLVLSHLVHDMMKDKKGTVTSGELTIADSTSGRLLPNGIFARWQAS